MGSVSDAVKLHEVLGAMDVGGFANVKMMLKDCNHASSCENTWELEVTKVKNTRIEALLRRTEGCFVVKLKKSQRAVGVSCSVDKRFIYETSYWDPLRLDAFNLAKVDHGHFADNFTAVYQLR